MSPGDATPLFQSVIATDDPGLPYPCPTPFLALKDLVFSIIKSRHRHILLELNCTPNAESKLFSPSLAFISREDEAV